MEQLQAILRYQEVDKKLLALEKELASSAERKEYAKAKKFMEAAPEKLDALEAKALSLKAEAAKLEEAYVRTEETLSDFDNLDELLASGADLSFYKKKAAEKVEKLKRIKADLNALVGNINAVSAEYQTLKKQVIKMQKEFAEAKAKYAEVKASKDGEKKEIETELSAIAADISGELMTKYATKRKERVFPIVGVLKGDRCPLCSMELPLAAKNQLTGGSSIECEYCHGLIFKE
jgi:predicted  nucleic acid-binding Zn-ribbon protein